MKGSLRVLVVVGGFVLGAVLMAELGQVRGGVFYKTFTSVPVTWPANEWAVIGAGLLGALAVAWLVYRRSGNRQR